MTNPITGDYDAVLQVSGQTLNRLVASLHQNAWAKPKLPSFPHSITLRIGDGPSIEGVRGWIDAQTSTPRVELIHGVSDRFNFQVDIRARFTADPSSTPIPEFIHGTVFAQYQIHDIDPRCHGWENRSKDYVWFRVVRDSVVFKGTAESDSNPFIIVTGIVDEAAINNRISRLIAFLLATRFEATPHRVSQRFRPSNMRSLSAPIGGSAIAIPIILSGAPAGSITSLDNLFLDGHDFAIALHVDVLMGIVQPMLIEIRALAPTYTTVFTSFIGTTTTIHSTARVTGATAKWEANGGDHAILRLHADGVVDSDSSLAPDISFSVDQAIWVQFDPDGEALVPTALEPAISVHAHGLLATQSLTDKVAAAIKAAVKARTQGLGPISVSGRAELVAQLTTLDDRAGAAFQDAVFTIYGVVMRGRIWVAPRLAPVVKFHMMGKRDGFSAYEAWAPGGRIDTIHWSWAVDNGTPNQDSTRSDRFVLERPKARRSKWGGSFLTGTQQLPGLDTAGIVCLTLTGVQLNPVTGHDEPFVTRRQCTRYGFFIGLGGYTDVGKLVHKLWPVGEKPGGPPPVEAGVIEIAGHSVDFSVSANTLIVNFGESFDADAGEALEQGIAACLREDAGLTIIALFREGILTRGQQILARIEELSMRVGVHAQAIEDVGGAWCARLAFAPDRLGFRLLTPGGGMTWMHDGKLEGDAIAQVLNVHLRKSPVSRAVIVKPAIERGQLVVGSTFRPDFNLEADSNCPSQPLGRLDSGAVVAFIDHNSESSKAQLRAILHHQRQKGDDAPVLIAVVDADTEAAAAIMRSNPDFVALSDSSGALAQRFGIRVRPTTMVIDGEGSVVGLAQGFEGMSNEETTRLKGNGVST
ncbi:MAG: hypothetical protein JWR80_4619 [Bradyrhizobium sp.]|nr:hypothetical protein [Bradyrhizobium sp.]